MLIYTIDYELYIKLSDGDYGKPHVNKLLVRSDKEIEGYLFREYLNKKWKNHYRRNFGKIEILFIYYQNINDIPTYEYLINDLEDQIKTNDILFGDSK